MYWYWAFQSSVEFSALDTSFMAISFFAGSSRPGPAAEAAATCGTPMAAAEVSAPSAARTPRREG